MLDLDLESQKLPEGQLPKSSGNYASEIWGGESNEMIHNILSRRSREGTNQEAAKIGNDSWKSKTKQKQQGTFRGVYVPIVYTMWGVLIFIRFGIIVGNTGWVMAIGFTFLSFFAQVLTTLSLCALASNQQSKEGGIYGMLVYNLGRTISSAIGILYYLGMTFLASVELLGSVQVIDQILETSTGHEAVLVNEYIDQIVIGGSILSVLAIIRIVNLRLLHSLSLIILFLLLLTFLAGFGGLFATLGGWKVDEDAGITGLSLETLANNTWPEFSVDTEVPTPSAAIALIFPSFLGVFQGANKAGDLRNPDRSIIKGTLAACMTSLLLYTLLFMMLAAVATRETLKENILILSEISWPTKYICYVGSVAIGIGACLELLEMGPIVLQQIAIVGDHKFLQFLRVHKTSQKTGQPNYAIAVSFLINFCLLFVGAKSFELLAQMVTIWFLQAYGTTHLACFINERYKLAGWRPTFRYYHAFASSIGILCTIVIMVFVNWQQSLITICLEVLLIVFIKYVEEPSHSGLGGNGIYVSKALKFLLREQKIQFTSDCREFKEHMETFWEPQVLCFVSQDNDSGKVPQEHMNMLKWIQQLQSHGKSKNLTVVASVVKVQGDRSSEHTSRKFWQSIHEQTRRFEFALHRAMLEVKVKGFPKVVIETNENMATHSLLTQSVGIGTLKPNLIIIPFDTTTIDGQLHDLEMITNSCTTNGQSVILLKGLSLFPSDNTLERSTGTIDVWWLVHNGGLPVLIGHLLLSRSAWKNCKLRVFVAIQDEEISDHVLTQTKLETKQLRRILRVPKAEIIIVPITTKSTSLSDGSTSDIDSGLALNRIFQSPPSELAILPHENPQEFIGQIVGNEDSVGKPYVSTECHSGQLSNNITGLDVSTLSPKLHENVTIDIKSNSKRKHYHGRWNVAIDVFGKVLKEHSSKAELVIMNCPPPTVCVSQRLGYREALGILLQGIDRVALVAATGEEKITC